MLKKILLWAGCILLTGLPSVVCSQTPIVEDPAVETYQLENGLTVFLQPRQKNGLELRLIVHSGSVQETENQLGLAHFVEHMAFKGTKNFPDKSSFKLLEQYGINLGSHINAVTSFNSTVYRLSLPNGETDRLHLGLTVLSDWAYHISFDEKAYENERDVIIEEWRLRQGVSYRINSKLDELRYHGSLYKDRAPIGSLETIKKAPVSEVKSYYRQWYQPQRMSLVIVGKFNSKQIKKEIANLFGSQARGDSPVDMPELRSFKPQPSPLVNVILDKEQGQRIVQLALQRSLPTPLNTRQGMEDDILDLVWLTILNQRLSLLTENQILPAARVNEQGTLFDERRLQYLIFVQPKDAGYLDIMRNLFTELRRLSSTPVSEAELQQVKQQILSKLKQQAENEANYQNDYLADRLVNAIENKLPIQNKAQQLKTTTNVLNGITVTGLQDIIAQRINDADLRIAIIGPDSDAKAANAGKIVQLWNSIKQTKPGPFNYQKQEISIDIAPPKSGTIKTQQGISDIKGYEWLLSNGVRVIVHPDKKLTGDVEVLLRIPGGLSTDANARLGEMRWAQRLAESSGYGKYSAAQLQQFSKQNRVQVMPYAELLYHGLQGKAPNDRLEPLFKLFYLKLTAANFDPAKLEQTKKQFRLSYSKQPVERQFLDLINQNAFNQSRRLLVLPDGPWNQFTSEQLKRRYKQAFSLSTPTTIVISGNFDVDKVKPLIERWIASIETSKDKASWVDNGITPVHQAVQKAYPIASSDKAMVSMLYSAEHSWSLRDQLSIELIDYVVNLRLRYYVREQASGVYAIIFSQQLIKHPSPYYLARLNFTTAPNRVKELTRLAHDVVQKTAQNGITRSELEQAKKAWLIDYEEKRESSTYWVTAIAQTATDDNRFDELAAQKEIVKKISLEEVNQLAQSVLGKNLKEFTLLPKQQ